MLYDSSNTKLQVFRSHFFANWLLVLVVVSVAGTVHLVTSPQALAHEDNNPFPNFKAGQVTGIQGATIQIDNTNYPMVSSVTITDQYENPVSLKDITQGERVLFHLDNKERIDKLVVWIPS